MRLILMLLLAGLLMTTIGCAGDDPQSRAWQQQQVEHLQQQAEHNTATAKALVEADAQARQQLVALERDVQAERAEVGRQRDSIETERKSLADERQRAPLIAATVHGLGTIVLAALPLVVCWLLLRNSPATNDSEELEKLLILNLAGEERTLSGAYQLPAPLADRCTPALEFEQSSQSSAGTRAGPDDDADSSHSAAVSS